MISGQLRLRLSEDLRAALPRLGLLTDREREVFGLLQRGPSNSDLASELYITERTAKAHVASIVDKLGLGSRLQVCLLACVHESEDWPDGQ